MSSRLPNGFINKTWDWAEVSIRNCIQSKVFSENGKLMAYCAKGHRLGHSKKTLPGKRTGTRLYNVLSNKIYLPESCRGCSDFAHDRPAYQ